MINGTRRYVNLASLNPKWLHGSKRFRKTEVCYDIDNRISMNIPNHFNDKASGSNVHKCDIISNSPNCKLRVSTFNNQCSLSAHFKSTIAV